MRSSSPSKHWARSLPSRRGLYVLYRKRREKGKDKYDVVYIGLATSGIRGRLESHERSKGELWSAFLPAFEVWDNIRDEEMVEVSRDLFRRFLQEGHTSQQAERPAQLQEAVRGSAERSPDVEARSGRGGPTSRMRSRRSRRKRWSFAADPPCSADYAGAGGTGSGVTHEPEAGIAGRGAARLLLARLPRRRRSGVSADHGAHGADTGPRRSRSRRQRGLREVSIRLVSCGKGGTASARRAAHECWAAQGPLG